MATHKKFRLLFGSCIALVVGCLGLCALIGKGLVFQDAGSRATALVVVVLFLGVLICATLLTGLMSLAPSEKVESPRLQLGLTGWPRIQQGPNLLELPDRESGLHIALQRATRHLHGHCDWLTTMTRLIEEVRLVLQGRL